MAMQRSALLRKPKSWNLKSWFSKPYCLDSAGRSLSSTGYAAKKKVDSV